jgi:hypothetical protein
MKVVKTIDLDEEMILAILTGIDELMNTGEWGPDMKDKQVESVYNGLKKVRNVLSYKDQKIYKL